MIRTAPWFRYSATAWALPADQARVAMALEEEELRRFLCRALPRHGRPLWRRRGANLVTDEGARWLITHAFVAPKTTIPWHLMLKGAGALANSHTMASHAGWSELTGYSQTARPALTIASPSSGRSSSNAATVASITADASITVAGAVLTSSPTKGGTTGTLYGGADFASAQALTSGQILQLTATVSF